MHCLKNGKTNGSDGITAELLKNGTIKITKVFNPYINGHAGPEERKTTYITSIYQKGDDENKYRNYREISATSTMSFIEDDYPRFEEVQGGFRAGRSYTDKCSVLIKK